MNKEKLIFILKGVKKDIVEMIYEVKLGYLGGFLFCSDIIIYLYNEKMNVDVNNFKDFNRDRFVLSKGYVVLVIYFVLVEKGYFFKEELNKLRKVGVFF